MNYITQWGVCVWGGGDQTVKVSPAQPFLAVAYVLCSSDRRGINSAAMTPM